MIGRGVDHPSIASGGKRYFVFVERGLRSKISAAASSVLGNTIMYTKIQKTTIWRRSV